MNAINKYLPLGLRAKRSYHFLLFLSFLPSLVLLLIWWIDKMIYPPPQVIFALLILSTAVVLIWDIRYNPFGEDQDGI